MNDIYKDKFKKALKKINQIRLDDGSMPTSNSHIIGRKKQSHVGLTLTDRSIISSLDFSINRNYIEQLKKLIGHYLPKSRRIKKHNLEWLSTTTNNALDASPKYVSYYNISIPIFNLGNSTTDSFRDWENEWGSSNEVSGKKMKRIVKKCHKFINNALSVYSKPKNLFKLSFHANFILGIKINPVNNDDLKKNKKLLKAHPKKYNPKLSVRFINERLNFRW